MHRGAIEFDAEELFGNLTDVGVASNTVKGFETYWECPKAIGNGFVSVITPRPGIVLEVGNCRLREDIAVNFAQMPGSVAFGFGVSGSIKYTFESEKGIDGYWGHNEGRSVMGYLPRRGQSVVKISTNREVSFVNIAIDPLLLKTFIDGPHDQMPIELQNIANGAAQQHFYQPSAMTPTINMAIQQIISCPYHASLKRLFLESKALELIAYSLAQFVSSADSLQQSVELRPDDIESVIEARNILLGNLENPPSLLALARQVGINKNKLNKGFRKAFGTTVFDYLRIRRLERARDLLGRKKMNVSEAAALVGYSHQSSFARAFKNHFGKIPTAHFH